MANSLSRICITLGVGSRIEASNSWMENGDNFSLELIRALSFSASSFCWAHEMRADAAKSKRAVLDRNLWGNTAGCIVSDVTLWQGC
ncbi:hypothetical protein KL86DPRO_40096 [uncultured delta proteobacterium]|uniref:Uncharacterized protein n=1 Tax=uncultured delta proteobacterium TaxID=34034 RepID=A0A212K9N2_9DELT|nr:hypothetical protein KL86DPRO_40096 [uncultured delta proteobacterium]